MYDFAAHTHTEVHMPMYIHNNGCMIESNNCIINLVPSIKVEYSHKHDIICERNADFH